MKIKSLKICNDEELFDMIKKGRRGAFDELYHRYRRPLMAYTMKRVEPAEAEDLMHDLWVKIWERREDISIQGLVVSYLFKAARNRVIDFMSSSARSQRYTGSIEEFADLYYSGDGADYALREQLFRNSIAKTLAQYSSKAQQIVELRMQGFKNQEIADQLELSEKTVRNQLSATLKFLRGKIKYFGCLLAVICIYYFT